MPRNSPGYHRKYYQENKDKILKKVKEYNQKNKEERMEYLKNKKRRIISGDYEKEWAKRHTEGIRKTPAVPCTNCKRKTRGKCKCQFCGHEFTEKEMKGRIRIQKRIYKESGKNQS